ncbi:glycosyltransferase [Roseovarius tibetensis]|uniref:glycosyltransferase n=1 Tax=Roseovarius tibetensis TaxID=2685897 RepID=UPI003D7F806C
MAEPPHRQVPLGAGEGNAVQFDIIIPVFNAGPKIVRTIDSLLAQTALDTPETGLRCIVMDGGSTDDTVSHVTNIDDSRIEVHVAPDRGMYDALAKGLQRAGGDVTGYLAAGETLDPHAFAVTAEVMLRYPRIAWITGQDITRNANQQITQCRLPHPFVRRLFDCGMYGTRLPVLQQESTLWRSALNRHIDLEELARCKLAGDFYIWRSLARHEQLYVIDTHIGSFTVEAGQLSMQNPGAHRREIKTLRRRPALWERIWALSRHIRTGRGRGHPGTPAPHLVRFDMVNRTWRLTKE